MKGLIERCPQVQTIKTEWLPGHFDTLVARIFLRNGHEVEVYFKGSEATKKPEEIINKCEEAVKSHIDSIFGSHE